MLALEFIHLKYVFRQEPKLQRVKIRLTLGIINSSSY